MPLIKTKAIVFSTIKYGDSNLIVRCFTQKEGIKSYMIRNILKSKKGKLKPAYFQPLSQLQLITNHKSNQKLHSINEVQVAYLYKTIYTTITKQTIVLFLSEILSSVIKEEEENQALYYYLESAFIWLDVHFSIANFHLLFLLNLSHFLGFYPNVSQSDKRGFYLLEGKFTNSIHQKEMITGQELVLFKKLLGIHFDSIKDIPFDKQERKKILQIIIRYFQLHLETFKKPKSLDVLQTVFD